VPCVEESIGDPSLLAYFSITPGKKCDPHVWKTLYLIKDVRLGIDWHIASGGISTNVQVVEPGPIDVAEHMTSCLQVAPQQTYIDEWLVAKGRPCSNRGDFVGRHRRYVNSRVCIMGAYNCVLTSLLTPTGKARLDAVFGRLVTKKLQKE
jgi:hypothetical protein